MSPWGMFREACWAGTAAPCPEEPERQERSFRTELLLNRHPLYVYVLSSVPEAPEEVQGLIGLTPDQLGLC